MKNTKLVSMENLFNMIGYNYIDFKEDSEKDVSSKNIYIKSYNHNDNSIEFKKILLLIRKKDSLVYEVLTEDNTLLLKATGDHRIFDVKSNEYIPLKKAKNCYVLTESNQNIPIIVKKTNYTSPILDIEVEDNENYFSNGILSHNTGGNGLKFYSSIRCQTYKKEIINDEKNVPTGMLIRIKNTKNKVGNPYRECEIKLSFKEGFIIEDEWIEIAIKEKIIEKTGGWYSLPGLPEKIQGLENVIKYLKNNRELYDTLIDKAKKVVYSNNDIISIGEITVDIENKSIEE